MTKTFDSIKCRELSRKNFKQVGGFLPAFGVMKDNFTFERNFNLNFLSLKNIIQNFLIFLQETNLRLETFAQS